jgi:hypothetical protein
LQPQRAAAEQQPSVIDQQPSRDFNNAAGDLPVQQGQLLLSLTNAVNELIAAINT